MGATDLTTRLSNGLKYVLGTATSFLTGKGIDTPRLDSELLLAHALGLERSGLFADLSRPLGPRELEAFQCLVRRRAEREPVAYILGKKEFWSMEFKVDRRTLIPRPETELLVSCVLERVGQGESMVLDMGTGSGILPVVLAKELGLVKIVAVDCSEGALELARENAETHQVENMIEFVYGNLFDPLAEGRCEGFDFIVSNPPYIPTAEIRTLAPEIKNYEPIQALDGGDDGLKVIRQIIKRSPEYLKSGGFLCMEIGAGQGARAKEIILQDGKFECPLILKDYGGLDRVVLAIRK